VPLGAAIDWRLPVACPGERVGDRLAVLAVGAVPVPVLLNLWSSARRGLDWRARIAPEDQGEPR
jgi:hypothetical protein